MIVQHQGCDTTHNIGREEKKNCYDFNLVWLGKIGLSDFSHTL